MSFLVSKKASNGLDAKTTHKEQNHSCRPCSKRQNGSALVEFSAFSFLFFVFAILAIHISVALYGAYFNNRACRDAARAAAQAENTTPGAGVIQATKLAASVLKAHSTAGTFLQTPTLSAPIVYQDYGGSYTPLTPPYVQVTTSTVATLPFRPLSFLAAGTVLQDGHLTFTKTYTFPIVRVK